MDMKIGVPKEIKIRELRVALTPAGADVLVKHGHEVFVERGAGIGSGISDGEYAAAGARILDGPEEVWGESQMIMKVKEPLGPEFARMREGQLLFTYLHLAADEHLTRTLLEKKIVGIAYETVQASDGSLPLLAPMSEVAGRLAIQMGCACLEAKNGGEGLLLSGVPGVRAAHVTILGGGISGLNAAHLATGMGARVTILDVNLARLRYLEDIFHGRVQTLVSNPTTIRESVTDADLVIGSVLIPGAKAPKLVTWELIENMKPGSAFVDIAIDQGGCAESSKATTHDAPTFVVKGVVHYCVANMPGAVPRTSTYALTNATLPYAVRIANLGWEKAATGDQAIAKGLNVCKGDLTCAQVASAFNMKCREYRVA
jgi:alanine dehydrogenase